MSILLVLLTEETLAFKTIMAFQHDTVLWLSKIQNNSIPKLNYHQISIFSSEAAL